MFGDHKPLGGIACLAEGSRSLGVTVEALPQFQPGISGCDYIPTTVNPCLHAFLTKSIETI